ncbi:pyrroloquinoline quinone-dependent dehydrogenase [Sphingomonas sp. SUN039]|uniref:pyrroloquinoline quinone-dependent dehydrogenase n=1 Tax=Sphingomonas sp. SUN039 TaxID=2937787 RepID=UPI0021647026|nr:pyrroloquinoline quinone-dependent dehydrogenase [Sphingomonas sp. SUN039]UVO53122.1 pyrroloquinoline quinone-dependent dehydrogenase [Sphingomonas sp. SUN039]
MRRVLLPICLSLLSGAAVAAPGDWPTYGHDKGGQRFSPLAQITPANVAQLSAAWVYHMKPPAEPVAAPTATDTVQRAAEAVGPPTRRRSRFSGSQATPLIVDGKLFLTTPYGRVVALDPATGKELWVTPIAGPGQPSLRGLEYWPGDATTPPRLFFGTRDGRLIALDAKTGMPVAGFGTAGTVNMATPEVVGSGNPQFYGMTSPPIVYGDLVITGSAVQEFPAKGAAGDVRAWDARTGRLAWTFHSVPRKGEAGYDSWQPGSAEGRSGVNAWGFLTVDEARGIVYMPFGAPAFDRYGGDRKGDNLYGTSLVAADAKTGKYLWHFQVVHHDIWDNDLQAPPLLFDAQVGGKTIPAVSVVSKNGLMFILDRVTGKPIHAVEERAFPPSDVPGEVAPPTQPIPVVTPPLARTTFDPETDIADVTPELKNWCAKWIADNKMVAGGLYVPVKLDKSTISFPGLQGGANWGGSAYDPTSGLIFTNTSDLGQVTSLVPSDGPLPYARGTVSGRFQQDEPKMMCQKTPWGRLSAVDSRTGKLVWQVPLGITDDLPPEKAKTGRPNIGGAIATASGLVFIGATDDSRFRAFDSATGKELWTTKLDASAHATPATYQGADGRQYVVVTSTGGSFLDSPLASDTVTAFALPTGNATK